MLTSNNDIKIVVNSSSTDDTCTDALDVPICPKLSDALALAAARPVTFLLEDASIRISDTLVFRSLVVQMIGSHPSGRTVIHCDTQEPCFLVNKLIRADFKSLKFTGAFDSAMEISDTPLVRITDCVFFNNSGSLGGALSVVDSTQLELSNVIFELNSATSHGGAIYLPYGTIIADNCQFLSNTAGGGGGAIYWRANEPTLSGVTFTSNHALYGDNLATSIFESALVSPLKALLSSGELVSCVDGGFLRVEMLDWYGNRVRTEQSMVLNIAVYDIGGTISPVAIPAQFSNFESEGMIEATDLRVGFEVHQSAYFLRTLVSQLVRSTALHLRLWWE